MVVNPTRTKNFLYKKKSPLLAAWIFYFNYEQYGRDLALSGFGQYGRHWVSVG
jgi:hypothetical protein